MQPRYIYEHWYKSNRDILLFDNSITLHNRKIENNGTIPNRIGLRIQFDYNNLIENYEPFVHHQQYNLQRQHRISMMAVATQGMEHVN